MLRKNLYGGCGFKAVVKQKLSGFFRRKYPRVVVASTGRSGSTMLFDAIAASMGRGCLGGLYDKKIINTTVDKVLKGFVLRLNSLSNSPCMVCKTHDIAPGQEDVLPGVKYIFIYGDPLDSALSVKSMVAKNGESWFYQHLYHLRGEGALEDLFEKDVLNYEGQIKSWLAMRSGSVLCIDYDDLWDERDKLSDFLGFEVILPEKRERVEKVLPDVINGDMFDYLRAVKEEEKGKLR